MSKKFTISWSKPNIGEDEKRAILSVIESGWDSQGPLTKKFEGELSNYLDSNVSVVNSGTSAIICALLAHGFKPGDKVLVPDFTFFATLSSPKILGAKILTADIDLKTLNVSPVQVEEIVKNNDVKFVIVVDVAGLPVDVDAFEDLAKRYKFTLIEDAAQALGSQYKNKKIGSFEHTTIFSFHIAKQITTIEGGCITTGNNATFDEGTLFVNAVSGRVGIGTSTPHVSSHAVSFLFWHEQPRPGTWVYCYSSSELLILTLVVD